MKIQAIEVVISLIQIATYLVIITLMSSALTDTEIFESAEFYFNQLTQLPIFSL